MIETHDDAFLGGRLTIRQPAHGYRAGADPVFLAAAVPAKPGDSVLELGCGVGTALICLSARVEGLQLTGVERESQLAEIARFNGSANGVAAEIVQADIADMPSPVREQTFDHVMFNPPFFNRSAGSASPDELREVGRGKETPTGVWADAALKRLRPGGTLTLVNRITELPETLSALGYRLGGTRVLPLQPRQGKPAKLFVLRGKKGSRTAFKICPPVLLHKGEKHERDGDSYTETASNILRNGAPIELDC